MTQRLDCGIMYIMEQEKINTEDELKCWTNPHKVASAFRKNPILWRQLFDKQTGCCTICGKHQAELKRTMAIDHDHKTGKIRGLLCGQCNFLIGNAYEDINILKNAIKYLQKSN